MPILILGGRRELAEPTTALLLTEALTGRVGGFLELSQMLTGRVPLRELVLDTALSGEVPGTLSPTAYGAVHDLAMTAADLDVESFTWAAERGQGTRMDVTVIGGAQGGDVPAVTVSAGGQGGAFAAAGTLAEWEHELGPGGAETTTLHASDASLIPGATLPELVPWETQAELDELYRQKRAGQIALIPPLQRPTAQFDGRRMAVDAVALAALATVPHRLLAAPPFPGYDFRADGDGPTYSTFGKTAQQVVNDLWGVVGLQTGWEGGVLVVRPPGPTGDMVLPSPIERVRTERITLDAPTIEIQGGAPSDTAADGEDETPPDPTNPSNPANSPDPDERNGTGGSGFADGVSPTPQVGTVAANAVPLSWTAVRSASQYIIERIEGEARPYTLWGRLAVTTATQFVDDTVAPLHTYSYRLRVNAVAQAGSSQNTLYAPSEVAQVTTPPADADAPGPVTDLQGYYRSSTSVGVKWKPPVADPLDKEPPRKAPADRYRIQARRTTPDATLEAQVVTTQAWVLLEGLPVGAALRLSVVALNGTLESEPTLLDVQLVNLPPALVTEVRLTAPEELDADKRAVLRAEWDRASGATTYRLRYGAAPVGTDERQILYTGIRILTASELPDGDGPLNLDLSGLSYATRYAVQVMALNSVGETAWSPVGYAITTSEPPQPEPDPEADAFERAQASVLITTRRTDASAVKTTVWKSGGRVDATQVQTWGKVAVLKRDNPKEVQARWMQLSAVTTRNFYELPNWPLTLTASVTETLNYDVQEPGRELGREQERVVQEWSPQGWLNLRRTERSRAGWVEGVTDDDGNTTAREYKTQFEAVTEQWQPIGAGLWLYARTPSGTAPLPVFLRDSEGEGDWDVLETAAKGGQAETTVSEQAPPQATLPAKTKEATRKGEALPPTLPRTVGSPALARYPLDQPWFSSPAPASPPGDEGPEGKGGRDPDSPPPPVPAGPAEPTPTPAGSGDPTGTPEPAAADVGSPRQPLTYSYTVAGTGGGATIQTSIPWVRTAAGLARYAALLAQQGGPRLRITRTYILPTTPPSLDRAVSASAEGQNGNFSMTVVTETR
ncbi:fibronectin type III domain-containing protein [Deinococcus gobiensis]|uniref:Fibronectin type-III domain-containing protein n=1 Tax=Deinococcus gobiensis (strain DSM 21396 / JCM 16679 / CGMCC 1.7299 / I-0) TaxID=745776 RepID=H8GXR6_DEIGI|nr:fibronectin type III domain-containing protein [Deinococcus gobiensis]AFD25918.1 hypothetical protein DGo_CA1991 [Deinococcus gobiensis I-0]